MIIGYTCGAPIEVNHLIDSNRTKTFKQNALLLREMLLCRLVDKLTEENFDQIFNSLYCDIICASFSLSWAMVYVIIETPSQQHKGASENQPLQTFE